MKKQMTLLGALGVGAGLMYLLDPDRGRRRRAVLQDKALHLAKTANREIGKQSRDLQNRTRGVIAEAGKYFREEETTDALLEARVHTMLGRLSSHPHAIKAAVTDGQVRLDGMILAGELDDVLWGVSRMAGVRDVENNLEKHELSENIPVLQPNRKLDRKNGRTHSWTNPNLSPGLRLLSTVLGAGCAFYALRRRGLLGSAVGAVGTELLSLGLTNGFLENLGANDGKGILIQKSIRIDAPPRRVYEVCSHPENFPRFMSHVLNVKKIGEKDFEWTVDGLPGMPMVWHTRIVEAKPNGLIKWRSRDGERYWQQGEMRFEPDSGNRTRLHIKIRYHAPAGYIGNTIAWFFRVDPKTEMDDDLLRMKSFIETGKKPHDSVANIEKRRFLRLKVGEIMTESPAFCEPETDLREVTHLMVERNCGAIPVVDSRFTMIPVGIVTDRDVTRRAVAVGKDPRKLTAGDVMTDRVLKLTPDSTLDECVRMMEENQVRRIIVVDGNGELKGIVAQADIAGRAPEEMTAELVRDVSAAKSAA